MQPIIKMPLFIVTGASCAGKSTMCAELFKNEKDSIVMESDLLWNAVYDTPGDNYSAYRRVWMRVCASISQIGKPVVLCGCAVPEQFENQSERDLFTELHYLAVVCDENALRRRMTAGRSVTDQKWIQASVDFNNWLKNNADQTVPKIKLLDTTDSTPRQAAELAHDWIEHTL